MDNLQIDVVEDSEGEGEQNRLNAMREASSNEEHGQHDDFNAVERARRAFTRVFHIDINFLLPFPENFQLVPPAETANQIWARPLDFREVEGRFLSERDNVGPAEIPESVLRCFSKMVDFARNKIANIQQRYNDNEHHIKVLSTAKAKGNIPRFLQLEVPKIRFFEDDVRIGIQHKLGQHLDETSLKMLESILDERLKLRVKFIQEAEQLPNELSEGAADIWMEFQETWNGWDNLYPVKAILKNNEGNDVTRLIPLSTIVFRSAILMCRSQVSTQGEVERLKRAEASRNRREEQKLRREALAQVSALPREEAESSIEKRVLDILQANLQPISSRLLKVEEMVPSALASTGASRERGANTSKRSRESESDPTNEQREMKEKLKHLRAQINSLERQMKGNQKAPMTADTYGAKSMSARRSLEAEADQDPSEEPQFASDSETRKKKRQKGPRNSWRVCEESGHSGQSRYQDQARKPGLGKRGKPWKDKE